MLSAASQVCRDVRKAESCYNTHYGSIRVLNPCLVTHGLYLGILFFSVTSRCDDYPDVQGAVLAKFVKIQYPDIPASLYLTLPPLLLMPRPGMMAGRDSHGKEKLFRLGMSHFTA